MDRPLARRVLSLAAVYLLALGTGLGIFEVYLRTRHPELSRDATSDVVFDHRYNHSLGPNHEEIRQYQTYVIEKHYNSWGMAEPREPVVPKPPGVFRVLVMGDSFMQSPNATDSVAAVLEESLAGKRIGGRAIEVLNGGQSSYSPLLHWARFLHQYALLEPDAVVFAPDLTDVFDDYCRYQTYAVYDPSGRLARVEASDYGTGYRRYLERAGFYAVPLHSYRWIVSRLAMALEGRPSREARDGCQTIFAHSMMPQEYYSPGIAASLEFTLANVASFLGELGGRGIHRFVFTYPHRDQITGEMNRLFEFGISDACQKAGIPYRSFFDPMAAAHRRGVVIYAVEDMHFNLDGYRLLAEEVATFALEQPEQVLGARFD